MSELRIFINLLNSNKVEEMLYEYYLVHEDNLSERWQDEERFTRYLKAFYVERFNNAPQEIKSLLIEELKDEDLNVGVVESFVEIIRSSEATVRSTIDGADSSELQELEELNEDAVYEKLDDMHDWVRGLVIEHNNFLTIEQLKSGQYFLPMGYRLDEHEIRMIECSRYMIPVINLVHMHYDVLSDAFDETTTCDYSSIEDDVLRSIIPHTDKDNPEVDVILDDGTMVNYYKGDIRIYPCTFSKLVYYIKLMFVDNYYNGESNPLLKLVLEEEDSTCLDTDFDEMTEEQFERLFQFAIDMTTDICKSLMHVYSKKMIKESKKKVKELRELAIKYNL